MNGKIRRGTLMALVLAFAMASGSTAFARGPKYDTSLSTRMTHKLFRGTANFFLGFVEIPLAINEEVQMLDPFTGTIIGLGKGAFRTVRRMGVGAYEVVTFPIPAPPRYRPILQPEVVMMDEV